jgi:ABC-type transporter Mla MlaB component
MSTRRKPGKAGKKSAPAKKAAVARARTSAPAKRAAAKSSVSKSAPAKAAAKGRAPASAASAPLAAIPADCTIAQAADLKADLARVLTKPVAVTIDLSAVRRIDTAALQVLTSFIRERRAAGRGVECQGASDAFLATADVLGLRALFT